MPTKYPKCNIEQVIRYLRISSSGKMFALEITNLGITLSALMVCKTTKRCIASEGGPRIKFCITSMFRGWELGELRKKQKKSVRRVTSEKGTREK